MDNSKNKLNSKKNGFVSQKKKKKKALSVCLAKIIFANLFYYSVYFYYYSWALLYFLILFMGLTVLFQLTFTTVLLTKVFSFSKISGSQTNNVCNFCKLILLFTLFLLLFMDPTVLFDIIHKSHCTISTNF